jgi:serine/threonine protein phosphatase PrpC
MEDAHTAVLNVDSHPDAAEVNAFFAVYDGHGGASQNFCFGIHDAKFR